MTFKYEHVPDMQDLIKQIEICEGQHTQQAIFSTFHGALTQVCFGCLKVRSTIYRTAPSPDKATSTNSEAREGGATLQTNLAEGEK